MPRSASPPIQPCSGPWATAPGRPKVNNGPGTAPHRSQPGSRHCCSTPLGTTEACSSAAATCPPPKTSAPGGTPSSRAIVDESVAAAHRGSRRAVRQTTAARCQLARDGVAVGVAAAGLRDLQCPPAQQPCHRDGGKLSRGRGQDHGQQRREWPARRAAGPGTTTDPQTAYDGHGDERPCTQPDWASPWYSAMPKANRISAIADGKVNPAQAASSPSQPARPNQRHTDLAAGRPRQELAQGDQIG